MRIAYLGPAGTFTEDALGEAAAASEFEPLRTATIHDAILAVERGEADRALVPFENSIEGSVRGTLDTLAFEAEAVTIVGEHDYAVRAHLIGREAVELGEIEAVLSHQQPLAQCARFLREQLAGVELRSVSSTAAAVRMVAESVRPWAAIGSPRRGRALRLRDPPRGDPGRGRQRHPLRLDRARRDRARAAAGRGRPRSSSPSSAKTIPAPWSTPCASSPTARSTSPASSRGRCAAASAATCSSATSREPRATPPVAEAIAALRAKAESVRILGSYPVG